MMHWTSLYRDPRNAVLLYNITYQINLDTLNSKVINEVDPEGLSNCLYTLHGPVPVQCN